jgi:hypothetical protein
MSIMNALNRNHKMGLIIWLEIAMFGLTLATLWLDEFLDLPYRLLNAPPRPFRIEEYFIESASVAFVGIVSVLMTWIMMKRLERAEGFVRICAWCRRVSLNDHWVNIEEYLHQEQDLQATHGICELCLQKAKEEMRTPAV